MIPAQVSLGDGEPLFSLHTMMSGLFFFLFGCMLMSLDVTRIAIPSSAEITQAPRQGPSSYLKF